MILRARTRYERARDPGANGETPNGAGRFRARIRLFLFAYFLQFSSHSIPVANVVVMQDMMHAVQHRPLAFAASQSFRVAILEFV